LVGRHQILAFFALTFAISWAIWWAMASMSLSISTSGGALLNVFALSGPSITALILSVVLGGGALRRLLDGFPSPGLPSGGGSSPCCCLWR
jgi:hypothetical protein